MKEYKGSPAHDAGLLAAAQAVEHEEDGPKTGDQFRGGGAGPGSLMLPRPMTFLMPPSLLARRRRYSLVWTTFKRR